MTQLTIKLSEPIADYDYIEAQVLAADQDNQATPVAAEFWSSLRELAVRTASAHEFEGQKPC